MASLKTKRRLAAEILKVGLDRVWFDQERIDDIKAAITKEDIRELIKEGTIKKKSIKGIRRRAARKHLIRKRKGRGRGPGRIKKYVVDRKREYVTMIRKLRSYLRALKNRKIINSKEYQKLRSYAKAGMFTRKQDIDDFIKTKLKK